MFMTPKMLPKSKLIDKYPWTKIHTWEYVSDGYRVPTRGQQLDSLFYLHNEFGNIWTHLIGYFWACWLTFQTVQSKPPIELQFWVFLIYHLSFVVSFAISTLYHLKCSQSFDVCKYWQKLDWLCISLLVWSSNFFGSFFELYYFSPLAFGVFNLLNFLGFLTTWFLNYFSLELMFKMSNNETVQIRSRFNNSLIQSYAFRIIISVSFASGLLLVVLFRCLLDPSYFESSQSIEGILQMYAAYGTVLLCYFHFPEKLFSSYSSFVFSHSLFHIGTIFGYSILFYTYFLRN